MGEIHYEDGNIHNPVIVVGEDPTNEDNVFISRLATSVSVPKVTLSQEEGTPQHRIDNPAVNSNDPNSAIQRLEAKVAELTKKLEGKDTETKTDDRTKNVSTEEAVVTNEEENNGGGEGDS